MEQIIRYIDTHSHIYFPQYDADRAEVLSRMVEAGVSTIVIGVNKELSAKALSFAKENGFLATAGLHPSDARAEEFDEEALRELLAEPAVVAVGECGLDYSRLKTGEEESEKVRQRELLEKQLVLAEEFNKPVVVHCRDAHRDMTAILKKHTARAVLHFFTGTIEDAKQYLELGAYISFSGVVTFAPMYEDLVKFVPSDRILVETDAPYAAPVPHRGKRNEPVFVIDTLKYIAKIREEDENALREQILANTKQAFSL